MLARQKFMSMTKTAGTMIKLISIPQLNQKADFVLRNAILRNNLHSNIKNLFRALCYEATRSCKRIRNRIFKEVGLAAQLLVSQSPRWNTAIHAVLLKNLFESPKGQPALLALFPLFVTVTVWVPALYDLSACR